MCTLHCLPSAGHRSIPSMNCYGKNMTTNPIVVGIIGGVASGKSEVSKQFVRRGAARIDADELAHWLLNVPEIQSKIIERFGPMILDRSKNVDRKKMAALVFGDDELSRKRRSDLELILHPAIRMSTEQRLNALRSQVELPMIVLDAPLLIEANWQALCNEIVFVETPLALRQELAQNRGWSTDEHNKREAAQRSIPEKRVAATQVILNDGSVDELHAKVDQLFDQLTRLKT